MKLRIFSTLMLVLLTALPLCAQTEVLYVFSNTNTSYQPVYGYGQEATRDFFNDGDQLVNGDVTITCNNLVNWYLALNGGSSLRVYTGGKITVSVPSGNLITKVRLKKSSLNFAPKSDIGNVVQQNFKYWDWNGSTQSVSFSCTQENTYNGMDSLWVRYIAAPVVAVSRVGYATLYNAKPLVVPSGVEAAAAYATSTSVQMDFLYQEGETIPANTGVVIKASEGSYTFLESAEDGDTPAQNDLKGTTTDALTTGSGLFYKLSLAPNSRANETVGFYWGAQNGGAFTNKAGHAYLCIPNGVQSVPAMGFQFQETTGIAVPAEVQGAAAESYYDMQGRRVTQPASNGIYIRNGRKVLK